MKKKFLLSLCMIAALAALCLFVLPTQTEAAVEGDYTYFITDGKATITGYTGAGGDIIIPSTMGGCPVVIGEFAFSDCTSLTSVTIPMGISSIGDYAFYNCTNLTSVAISDTVGNNIGWKSFASCNIQKLIITEGSQKVTQYLVSSIVDRSILQQVLIPDSVISIEEFAFHDCSSLSYVMIGNGVSSVGNFAFENCTSLSSVTIPDSVTAIGDYAFRGCTGLTGVTFGKGVTYIGDSALENCTALTNVIFGSNVTHIGDSALGNSNHLVYNTYDSGYYLGNEDNPYLVLVKANSATQIHPNTRIVYSWAFGNSSITQITIPANLKGFGENAFANCMKLEDVYIYCTASDWCKIDGLEDSALQSWYGRRKHFMDSDGEELTKVVLDDTVIEIPTQAFYFAVNLTEITIADSVVHIGNKAFDECNVARNQYAGGNYMGTVTNPYFVLIEASAATQIHPDTKIIGSYAFAYSDLTSITIPDSVITIEALTFIGSESLTTVRIGSGVTSIGENAFLRCSALLEITIPDNVTVVGSYAFEDCTSLVTAKIGNGVRLVDVYTFEDCTNLTAIYLGESVREISSYAFKNCSKLKDVYIYDPSAWCNTQYGDLWSYAENLHILDEDDNELTAVALDTSVTYIPSNAFTGCSHLTSITIPDSVTSIGGYAFKNCSGLTAVTVPDSVNVIYSGAFSGCYGLRAMTVPFVGYGRDSAYPFGYIFGTTYYSYSIETEQQYRLWGTDPVSTKSYYIPMGLKEVTVTGGRIDADEETTIWHGAFYNCIALEKITLGENIAGLGDYAFYGCDRLSAITIPDSMEKIGISAFEDCNNLSEVTLGCGVTQIDNRAFYSCNSLSAITIPDSVIQIGTSAFEECEDLCVVTVGEGVKRIGSNAFLDCARCSVYIENVAPWCRIQFENYAANPLHSAVALYTDGVSVTELVIPGSVSKIGNYAFYKCEFLTSLVMEEGVSDIGNFTFFGCRYIESVSIPSSMNSIGDDAFWWVGPYDVYIYDASNWCRVQFGEGSANPMQSNVRGHIMNADGEELTHAVLTNVGTIPQNAFKNCVNLAGITLPSQLKIIGPDAFYGCTALEDLLLPAGLTEIGDGAFHHCIGLDTITVPDTVTVFGAGVFNDCKGLKTAAVGSGVEWLSKSTFSGCTSLKDIILQEGLLGIGESAFYSCSSLENIAIPDSVKTIGEGAFWHCSSLISIRIPANVTKMSYSSDIYEVTNPFVGCTSLTGIWVDENNANYCSDSTGSLLSKNKTVLYCVLAGLTGEYSVPYGVKTIGAEAFNSCVGLRYVSVCNGVNTISDYAFSGCRNLRAVRLPNSLTTVGAEIFEDCDSFTTIFYAGTRAQCNNISVHATYELPNEKYYSAIWHFEISYREFAQQTCWYCPDCGTCYLFSGEEALATVTFTDGDGNVLLTQRLPYGRVPATSLTPTRMHEQPEIYRYVFAGWSPNFVACTDDATYTATFEETYVDYKVQFVNYDGTVISEEFYHYGDTVTMPADPVRYPDNIYTYTFTGWDTPVEKCTGDKTYTATYTPSYIDYTVTFLDEDGTELSKMTYHWGDQVIMPADPTKPADDSFIYVFEGWNPAIADTCVGNATYTAVYMTEQYVGWKLSGGGWRYYTNGTALTGWQRIDNVWYYFNAFGIMQTGWVLDGKMWYYMNSSGAMQTGWVKNGNTWYYMNSSGAMVTGWLQVSNAWYYFSSSGAMQTGWLQLGNAWYYFNTGGAMVTGWLRQGNTWYFFNSGGAMVTGWLQSGGAWYYFNGSGAMVTGWLKLGNTWYYFNSSGAMATGSYKIGAKIYNFNSSGACLNP